jgi:uncharacterized oligopeptide transporter (OPT) family protein
MKAKANKMTTDKRRKRISSRDAGVSSKKTVATIIAAVATGERDMSCSMKTGKLLGA